MQDQRRDELNDEAYSQMPADVSSALEADRADDSELRRRAERFAADTSRAPDEAEPGEVDTAADVRAPSDDDIAATEDRHARRSRENALDDRGRSEMIREGQPESQGEPLDDFTAEHPPEDDDRQDAGDRQYAH